MAVATTTALALAAMAAAAASAYNTNRTAKKADSIAAQGIRKQGENQRRVNQKLQETLKQTAESNSESERKAANDSYINQVQNKMAAGTAGLAKQGVSQQFDEMAGQAKGQAADYAGTIAGLLSRIDAGAMQRQSEGNLMGDFQFNTGPDASAIQGDAFLNDMALRGVRRNPYIDFAASALNGYASGGAG